MVWFAPLNVTVPVPGVKVPLLDQFPVKFIGPDPTVSVPVMAISPPTFRLPLFKVIWLPVPIVSPAVWARDGISIRAINTSFANLTFNMGGALLHAGARSGRTGACFFVFYLAR